MPKTDHKVVNIKDAKPTKQVFFSKADVEGMHECPVCGWLAVVDGVIVHSFSKELHEGV